MELDLVDLIVMVEIIFMIQPFLLNRNDSVVVYLALEIEIIELITLQKIERVQRVKNLGIFILVQQKLFVFISKSYHVHALF